MTTKKAKSVYDSVEGEILTRTVKGRKITAKIVEMSVDELQYDPLNPRLTTFLKKKGIHGTASQAELHDAIMEKSGNKMEEFIKALSISGAPWDYLLVDSRGIVKEGNRRLAACRERSRKMADNRFDKVMVEIFPDDVTPDEWDAILDLRHINNQVPWDSIERAEHLARGIRSGEETVAKAAERLGWTEKALQNYLDAYKYIVTFREQFKDDPEFQEADHSDVFTKFWKLAGTPKLQNMLDPNHTSYCGKDMEWFNNMVKPTRRFARGRISHCLDVLKLPQILGNAHALETLESWSDPRSSPSKMAIEVLARSGIKQRRSSLEKSSEEFADALRKINAVKVSEFRQAEKTKTPENLDTRKQLQSLKAIRLRLEELIGQIEG